MSSSKIQTTALLRILATGCLCLLAIAILAGQRADATLFVATDDGGMADQKQGPPNQVKSSLSGRLDQAIEITSNRHLTANAHSPWQIFHSILATGNQCQLRLGNSKVNAIEWISTAEPRFDNEPVLLRTDYGARFHPYSKKYFFEGHQGQFLALLSEADIPLDHRFHVEGEVVRTQNLVDDLMKNVDKGGELTWVLWALQHYLEPDAVWSDKSDAQWSIERLVHVEASAPVIGAPNGGNHRLFALARARNKYLKKGGKLQGVWRQADDRIQEYIERAKTLQNDDGSFCSHFYKYSSTTSDPSTTLNLNERINTTGLTLEFLAIALPDERLHEQWVRKAVWTLSRDLVTHQNTQIDCGPLFHSLHALILYRDRIEARAAQNQAVPDGGGAKP